jgi:hypothetical protein
VSFLIKNIYIYIYKTKNFVFFFIKKKKKEDKKEKGMVVGSLSHVSTNRSGRGWLKGHPHLWGGLYGVRGSGEPPQSHLWGWPASPKGGDRQPPIFLFFFLKENIKF